MNKNQMSLPALIVGLLALALAHDGTLAAEPAQQPVKAATVVSEDLLRQTTQPAHVEPFERTAILAKASGYASKVNVDIGDRVEEGDVLASLWIPEMQQERQQKLALVEDAEAVVEQARARLRSADASIAAAEAAQAETQAGLEMHEADLALARSEHDRIQSLVSQRAVTETLLDEKVHTLRSTESALAAAKAKVQTAAAAVEVARAAKVQAQADANRAQAQVNVARADLEQTETLIQYAEIKAPYAGLITQRHVDTGDFVRSAGLSATEPLYTIVRDDRLRVVFDIPESQASQVKVGQPVVLVIDGLKGRLFEGTVSRMSGVLDPRTRTLRAEMDLVGNGTPLRPGMYGMATLTLADRRQAMLIPADAVRYDQQRPYVHRFAEGRWARTQVQLGFVGRQSAEVISGLRPGDRIAQGDEFMTKEGQPASVAALP